jgi:hypothetical protein
MQDENDSLNRLTPAMRGILLVASALVLIAGTQLFVLTEGTDRYFAWTIAVPLTAVFMGAGYFSSFALLAIAAIERSWSAARISAWSGTVFSVAMLVATLRHLGTLHLNTDHGTFARFAAEAWIAIYAVVPVLLIVLLVAQTRAPGVDPPRGGPLPERLRTMLLAQGAVMLMVGLALFIAPDQTAQIWPWKLTPFTSQIVGGWLLGLGVAAMQATFENDWARVRGASLGYLVFGVLQLVALARYPLAVDWNDSPALIYATFLVSVAVTGGYATFRAWRSTAAPHAIPTAGLAVSKDVTRAVYASMNKLS